jgi:ankyrin repeat protein
MVELSTVLPHHVIASANNTIVLQECLMALEDSTFDSALDLVTSLPFKLSSEGVMILTNNLLLAVQYRPFRLSLIARLTKTMIDISGEEDHLDEIRVFLKKIPPRIVDEKWRLALIHELLCLEVFNDDEVFSMITEFFHRFPILQNRPFWKNNTRQQFLFFVWFAPVLERKDPSLFESLLRRLSEDHKDHNLGETYTKYLAEFDQLRANNWSGYLYFVRNVHPPDSLAAILRADNLEKLLELSASPEFNVNRRINSSPFEYATFLMRQPTLLQFCALCDSINCFRFLVSKGADLTLTDATKRILLHFAIAGGNREIIDVAVKAVNDFAVATRVSAEYHRFELFRMFLASKKVNLKANDIENGSIFHGIAAANHIRMILFCIEQGCDVNLKDADGWTPLNCAIDYCALESVMVLSSHFGININAQDDYGISPLLRATINGEAEVIKVLLRHPSVDVNGIGLVFLCFSMFALSLKCSFDFFQTPLHRAAQNNNIEVMKLLVGHGDVNVNQVEHVCMALVMFYCVSWCFFVIDKTPMHFAAENGSLEAIRVLLSQGSADLTVRDVGLGFRIKSCILVMGKQLMTMLYGLDL